MKGETKARGERPASVQEPARKVRMSVAAVIAILGLAVFAYLIRQILIPFVLAGIVAYVCTPFVDRLAQRLRVRRWVGGIVLLILVMGIVAALIFIGSRTLVPEISRMAADVHGGVEGLARQIFGSGSFEVVGVRIDAASIADYAVAGLHDWLAQSGNLFMLAAMTFAGIFGFILMWVLLAYLLVDGPRIGRGLFWLVPPRHRPFAEMLWRELDPVLRRYFVGVAVIVAYASTAAYLGLGVALHLNGALFLALLTGFLEMIPLVGPAASALLGGLAAIEQAKSGWSILSYVIYAIALRISIDQFFGPIVLGKAARLSPFLVVFCFLSGGWLFGVIGVILSVPMALTIKVALHVTYEREPFLS